MYYFKQLFQFVRTKGAITLIVLFSLFVFLLLTKKYDLAIVNHSSDSGFEELLTVVIGVLATIIVTTFSAIVVALQLASAQFSPRILRGFFSQNGKVQFFLMSFFLCISYCLTIKFLGLVKVSDTFTVLGYNFHYATVGIMSGILLVLIVFPFFIYYIISNINVAHIISKISHRAIREIELLYERGWKLGDAATFSQPYPEDKDEYLEIYARRHGFLSSLNPLVLRIFKYLGHKVYIAEFVGGFVSRGSVIAYVDYKGDKESYKKMLSFILNLGMRVGYFRSYTQDVNFGIRQLADIAIKAISPAINDPTTAINCLNYIGEILQSFVHCKLPARNTKEFQKINIYVNEFNFDKLVDQSFDQIYYWGREDYLIVRHIIQIITNVIEVNKNPNNLAVLIQEVIDMELLEKSDQELKTIFKYDEYVRSLSDNFMKKFVRQSIFAIERFNSKKNKAGLNNAYEDISVKLDQQLITLNKWLKERSSI